MKQIYDFGRRTPPGLNEKCSGRNWSAVNLDCKPLWQFWEVSYFLSRPSYWVIQQSTGIPLSHCFALDIPSLRQLQGA